MPSLYSTTNNQMSLPIPMSVAAAPPATPPVTSSETFAAVIVGIIPGLLLIFLPLAQTLPTKLTSAEVVGAVISGVTLVVTTIAGWLAKRYGVTKMNMTLADNQAARDTQLTMTTAPSLVSRLRQDFDEIVPDVTNIIHEVVPKLQSDLTEVRNLANKLSLESNLSAEAVEALIKKVLAESEADIEVTVRKILASIGNATQ